jgi:hypothetical protein
MRAKVRTWLLPKQAELEGIIIEIIENIKRKSPRAALGLGGRCMICPTWVARSSGILPEEQSSQRGLIRSTPDGLGHEPMKRRILTGRVGMSGIASEERGLAATTSIVNLSLWTGSTRFWHPFGPAKPVKAFGFFPDPGERLLADIIENQSGNFRSGGAGQNRTIWIDGQIPSTPAAHAWLWATREIVG